MIGLYRRPFPRSEATGVAKLSPSQPAPPLPPFEYAYFVSPTGSAANPGTFESPWSLDHAIDGASGLIVPPLSGYLGVGLRGGDYPSPTFRRCTLVGEKRGGIDDPDGKIIFRNYNGEDVQPFCDSLSKGIDTFRIAGRYLWFWGINAWRKHTDRFGYPGPGNSWWMQGAVNAGQLVNGNKLIHCWGREGSNGVYIDSDTGFLEVYGAGFLHNGVTTNPSAHGFYGHHLRNSGEVGARLSLTDIISFDHLGNCGQLFASDESEALDDIDVLWLIAFHGGRLNGGGNLHVNLTFGGTQGASDVPLRGFTARYVISQNPVGHGSANLRLYDGGASTNEDAILEDCYLVGGTPGSGHGRLSIGVINWVTFVARRNTMINREQTQLISLNDSVFVSYVTWEDQAFFGSDPTSTRWRTGPGFTDRTWAAFKSFTGLGSTPGHEDTAQAALPAVTKVFVRPVNKYEYGRGHVVFFNWAGLPRVPVDLSPFLAIGDNIVVRNAQVASPERNPSATVQVYDAPTGGNVVSTWLGSPVYFPTDGVTPPPPYGFNNSALNAWVYQFNPAGFKTANGGFDVFIVSTR